MTSPVVETPPVEPAAPTLPAMVAESFAECDHSPHFALGYISVSLRAAALRYPGDRDIADALAMLTAWRAAHQRQSDSVAALAPVADTAVAA
jgi:hypothetical protein